MSTNQNRKQNIGIDDVHTNTAAHSSEVKDNKEKSAIWRNSPIQSSPITVFYEPTPKLREKDQFRIIYLLPGNDSDKIECELRVLSFEENEDYETLSYVWGEASNVESLLVSVSGSERPVTSNLYNALRRLRNPYNKRALWIDQLCINQWDKAEKAQQVQLMRRIYKNCSQCLIWLGESMGNPKFDHVDVVNAFDFLHYLSHSPEHIARGVPVLLSNEDAGERARDAFKAMMLHGNSWWSRVWTIQEAILPHRATVVFGEADIAWEILDKAADVLVNGPAHPVEIDSLINQQSEVYRPFLHGVKGLAATKDGESPLRTLQRWRYRDASDPLDKVYGLVGMFPNNPFPRAESCSYDISPQTLYSLITADIIDDECDLEVLIGRRGEPHVTSNLPSWAIDLTCYKYKKRHAWSWWTHCGRYGRFRADGGAQLSYKVDADFTVLTLQGVKVDKITLIGSCIIGEMYWENCTNELLITTIRTWKSEYDKGRLITGLSDRYVGSSHVDDAFWRTMLGDVITDEFPLRRATSTDQDLFNDFLNTGVRNEIRQALRDAIINQVFFMTECGYIGIGPPDTLIGDEVWILLGGNCPFILRPKVPEDSDRAEVQHLLVGDAYHVQGIMDGEFMESYTGETIEVHLV